MVKNYECQLCGMNFNNYSNYSSHLMKKKPCVLMVGTIKNEYTKAKMKNTCINNKSGTVGPYGNTKMGLGHNQKMGEEKEPITINGFHYNDMIETIVIHGKEYRKCSLCKKKFIYPSAIYKHFRDKKCAYMNDDDFTVEKNGFISDLNKNVLKSNKIITQVVYNNINYITNDNKVINQPQYITNNNTVNNLNINAWGNEKTNSIPNKVIENAVRDPERGIIDLIKHIHFNPDIPENSNLRLKKKKTQIMEIFDGEDWTVKDKDTIIHNLLTEKKDLMDQKCDLMLEENRINHFVSSNYKEFSEKLDSYLRHSLVNSGEMPKAELEKEYKLFYKKLAKKVMDVFVLDYEKRKVD